MRLLSLTQCYCASLQMSECVSGWSELSSERVSE